MTDLTTLQIYVGNGEDIDGDVDPNNFDFQLDLSNEKRLKLFERNEIMRLQVEWTVRESFRQKITFDVDQDVTTEKFGKPYTFKASSSKPETEQQPTKEPALPTEQPNMQQPPKSNKQAFLKYLDWIGFWTKMTEGCQWSWLFGTALTVFWDDKKPTNNTTFTLSDGTTMALEQYYQHTDGTIYIDLRCYYPICDGNGYEIVDVDEDGNPTLYRITTKTEGMKKAKVVYVDAKRTVLLPAPRTRIKFGGSSQTQGLELYALCSEQMIKAVLRRANLTSAGILAFKGVHSDAEFQALSTAIGADVTHLDRIGLGVDQDLEWKTPDLKVAGEVTALFDIITRIFARYTRISQKIMDGDSQGAISSAKTDMMASYAKIYAFQEHYTHALEQCFFMLGKEDTSFEWNEAEPGVMEPDFKIGGNFDFNDKPQAKSDNEDKTDTKE